MLGNRVGWSKVLPVGGLAEAPSGTFRHHSLSTCWGLGQGSQAVECWGSFSAPTISNNFISKATPNLNRHFNTDNVTPCFEKAPSDDLGFLSLICNIPIDKSAFWLQWLLDHTGRLGSSVPPRCLPGPGGSAVWH